MFLVRKVHTMSRTLIALAVVLAVLAVGILASTARARLAGRALPVHPFLRHPLSGEPLRAIGIVGGRLVWPVIGAAPTVLEQLDTSREALTKEIDDLVAKPMPDKPDEAKAANEAIQAKVEQRQALDERIRITKEQDVRRAADAKANDKLNVRLGPDGQPVAVITSEPRTTTRLPGTPTSSTWPAMRSSTRATATAV
jgi:hypothetical protein